MATACTKTHKHRNTLASLRHAGMFASTPTHVPMALRCVWRPLPSPGRPAAKKGIPMTSSNLKQGRISLTLREDTIRALKLLASLKGTPPSTAAEGLLLSGGLHEAVAAELDAARAGGSKVIPTSIPLQPADIPTGAASPVTSNTSLPHPYPATPISKKVAKVPNDDDDKIPW